jgi:hypothetical protein
MLIFVFVAEREIIFGVQTMTNSKPVDGTIYYEYHFEYKAKDEWIIHIPIFSRKEFTEAYNFSCLPYPKEVVLLRKIIHRQEFYSDQFYK